MERPTKMKLRDLLRERKLNKMNGSLKEIAKKHLGIKTLKTQNSDSLDFHDLAIWQIKSALRAAYRAGQKDIPQIEAEDKE